MQELALRLIAGLAGSMLGAAITLFIPYIKPRIVVALFLFAESVSLIQIALHYAK